MANLETVRGKLVAAITGRLQKARKAALIVKVALLAFASAVMAVAQFMQVPEGQALGAWQVSGIMASIVAAIGTVFVALTEEDASKQLAIAVEAIEQADKIESSFLGIDEVFESLNRTIELYQAIMAMRSAMEAMIASGVSEEEKLVSSILGVSGRSLSIAMDFDQSDQWTICVFKAEVGSDQRARLRCVAHHRAIQCEIENARVWEEGVGIAGVSYSNRGEVIIPDMTAEGLQTVFTSPRAEVRDYDDDRYRSMVAVPILVDGLEKPWGTVVCTSDQPGHFHPDGTTGTKTHEGGRALSGMIALAIAAARSSGQKAQFGA